MSGGIHFFVIAGLVGAAGLIIYFYGKKVGGGDFNAAFQDPKDRKKFFIFSAGVIVFFVLVYVGLVIGKVLG